MSTGGPGGGTLQILCGKTKLGLRFQRKNTDTDIHLGYSARLYHAIPHPHHLSADGGEAALPPGFLCPLTSAPFGHDHQRRRAEQRRLAPGDPTPAPPGRRRHPVGDRPDSVDHATDR